MSGSVIEARTASDGGTETPNIANVVVLDAWVRLQEQSNIIVSRKGQSDLTMRSGEIP